MLIDRLIHSTTVALFLTSLAMAQDKTAEPVIIDPVVKNYDSLPSISSARKYFIGTVQDTARSRDEGIVGRTRTGRKTLAPIESKPSPAVAVKRSFEGAFENKGIASSDPSTAAYVLQVMVLDFSLRETSKLLSQTMEARVKLEIKLIDPLDSTRTKGFIVESQSSRSSLDTTKLAGDVLRTALEGALREVLNTLEKT